MPASYSQVSFAAYPRAEDRAQVGRRLRTADVDHLDRDSYSGAAGGCRRYGRRGAMASRHFQKCRFHRPVRAQSRWFSPPGRKDSPACARRNFEQVAMNRLTARGDGRTERVLRLRQVEIRLPLREAGAFAIALDRW